MAVSMVKQYSVFLPNEPGSLNKVAKLLLDAGVNLIGIASEVRDDSGVVRLAVEADDDGADVLVSHGLSAIEKPLLSVELADRPGELYRVTAVLAKAGVNITTVYGTARSGSSCRILIAVNDSQKALKALEKWEKAGEAA
jgi:hypothetical protein